MLHPCLWQQKYLQSAPRTLVERLKLLWKLKIEIFSALESHLQRSTLALPESFQVNPHKTMVFLPRVVFFFFVVSSINPLFIWISLQGKQ